MKNSSKPVLILVGVVVCLSVIGNSLTQEPAASTPHQPGAGLVTVSTGNASPTWMQITLKSESNLYRVNVPPCTTCAVHVAKTPDGCHPNTVYQTYGVEPGNYTVEVRSLGSNQTYQDSLFLTLNQQEKHCFFSVHAPVERHSLQ